MSNDINNSIIVGRLVRDSELKYTNSGIAVANFTVASSEYQGANKDSHTNFIGCTLWAKRAEALNQYLMKGTQVIVQGTLHQSSWEQDGNKRSKIEINVSDIELVGGKKPTSQNKPFDAEGAFHGNSKPAQQDSFEDDIVF